MKKSPSSKKKQTDAVEQTPVEETVAETPVKASEAETVSLSDEEVPPTVSFNEDALAEEAPVKTIEYSADTVVATENEIMKNEEEAAQNAAQSEIPEPITTQAYQARPFAATTATAPGNDGIGALGKALIVGLIVLLAGVGLLVWKTKTGGSSSAETSNLTKLTKEDMSVLVQNIYGDNPQALKKISEDPEIRKKVAENFKQLLAVAEEARKSEIGSDPAVKADLEDVRQQIIAVSYDKEKNKDKEQMPPFSLISKEDVDKYYQNSANAEKVDKILKAKIAEAKEAGMIPKDQDPSEEELGQFKEQFAKINIYAKEATDNWDKLSPEFKHATELQIKLQQAQFLARKYAEKVLTKQVEVKDEDVTKYIAAHPDADPNGEVKKYMDANPTLTKEQKKAKADDLLKRAKAGEDFAKLAAEFSEDPGSKKDGGLYKDVAKGQMLPEFEKAALALEPGQITDAPVETKYGYHIIKLERKGITKDKDGKEQDTYDARHILISTMPDEGQQTPLSQLKQKIEGERQKKVLDEIVARNPVEVAEDFTVTVPPMPEQQPGGLPPGMKLDPKQMEQIQKQMKEMQDKQKKDGPPKPDAKKLEPKTK